MKTALVTTCWLGNQEYIDKTEKFLNHYSCENALEIELNQIILFDNASPFLSIKDMYYHYPITIAQRFPEHLPRTSHLEYPYLWRAVYYLKDVLKEYDKVIYMDNDFYILSDKMFDYINDLKSGWTTFWCNKHKFPETGCHVIVKDCKEYENFVNCSLEEFIKRHNGKTMETTLPVTHIEKGMIGDRYSEYETVPKIEMDFFAQARLEDKV